MGAERLRAMEFERQSAVSASEAYAARCEARQQQLHAAREEQAAGPEEGLRAQLTEQAAAWREHLAQEAATLQAEVRELKARLMEAEARGGGGGWGEGLRELGETLRGDRAGGGGGGEVARRLRGENERLRRDLKREVAEAVRAAERRTAEAHAVRAAAQRAEHARRVADLVREVEEVREHNEALQQQLSSQQRSSWLGWGGR